MVGISIRPCFFRICTTLCNTGCTNSACSLPNALPILLERSAIRSAISVADAGVLFGSPSISLYNALLILFLISPNTKSATSNLPALLIGCSPALPADFGMTVPGNREIESGLIIPSSSIW